MMEHLKPSPVEALAGFTASTEAEGGGLNPKETIPLTTLPPLTDSSSTLGGGLGVGQGAGVTLGGGLGGSDILQKIHTAHSSLETSLGGGAGLGVGVTLGGSDLLQKIHTTHSSAETSGLGDSLQRLHTLSSTETSGYGGGAHSPTGLGNPGGLYDHSPERSPGTFRHSPGATNQRSPVTESQPPRLNPTDPGAHDGHSSERSHQSPAGTTAASPRRLGVNIKELSPRSKRQHFKSASRTLRYDGSETFDQYDQEEQESDFKENLSVSPVQGEGVRELDVREVGLESRNSRQSPRPCGRSSVPHPLNAAHVTRSGRGREPYSEYKREPATGYTKHHQNTASVHAHPHRASPHTRTTTDVRSNKGYVKFERIERREEELEEELGDDMNKYFERASNQHHRRGGSYTPIASLPMTSSSSSEAGSRCSLNRKSSLDDTKSSLDAYFLGKNTKSTWLAWSEERRESLKRRQDSIEQRHRELEQNRVPTPVRKARKESVMFVSPELEEQHIIRDELLEQSERFYQQVSYSLECIVISSVFLVGV